MRAPAAHALRTQARAQSARPQHHRFAVATHQNAALLQQNFPPKPLVLPIQHFTTPAFPLPQVTTGPVFHMLAPLPVAGLGGTVPVVRAQPAFVQLQAVPVGTLVWHTQTVAVQLSEQQGQ